VARLLGARIGRYRGRVIERSEQGADPTAAADSGFDGVSGPLPAVAPKRLRKGRSPWARSPSRPSPPATPTTQPPAGWSPVVAATDHPGADVSLGRQLDAGAAPDSRSSAWMWLVFFCLGFLAGQIIAEIFAALTANVVDKSVSLGALAKLSEPPTWYIVSTLLGLWAGFFGSAEMATRARGTKSLLRDLGLRFRWRDALGVPIGAGGQLLVALVYIPISHHVHDFSQRFDAPSQRLTGGSHGAGFFVIAVFTVVGAPFFEELYFRGVLLRALARLFGRAGGWVGPALAIVVTGLVFALFHFEALQYAGLALFGIILSFVSYRTGRLGMNMVAHATFNLTAVAAAVMAPLALAHGGIA